MKLWSPRRPFPKKSTAISWLMLNLIYLNCHNHRQQSLRLSQLRRALIILWFLKNLSTSASLRYFLKSLGRNIFWMIYAYIWITCQSTRAPMQKIEWMNSDSPMCTQHHTVQPITALKKFSPFSRGTWRQRGWSFYKRVLSLKWINWYLKFLML